MLPLSLIYTMESRDSSFVEFTNENPEEIKQQFESIFSKNWELALQTIIEDTGIEYNKTDDYYSANYPASTFIRNEKLIVTFSPLRISYNHNDYCNTKAPGEALQNTLNELMEKYPNLSYDGYVCFAWTDKSGGDVIQYPISSKRPILEKTYPILAEIINDAVYGVPVFDTNAEREENDDAFLDNLLSEIVNFDEDELETMREFLDEYDYYLDETVRDGLCYVLREAEKDLN